MLEFKIKQTLELSGKKNISKWLMTTCDISRGMAYKILNNTMESLNLKDISKICEFLNCTPNDLMYWKQTASSQLPPNHPCLTELKPPLELKNWHGIFNNLNPGQINELKDIALEKIKEGKK